ncbi:MAG: hypothetical protein Q7S10_03870 [bacterium]|nr:hypothetical protein [bacterium]
MTRLFNAVEEAAGGLIEYAEDLVKQEHFPEALCGTSYECAHSLLEWVLEATSEGSGQRVRKQERAKRVMAAIVTLNLPIGDNAVRVWKNASENWAEYRRLHPNEIAS